MGEGEGKATKKSSANFLYDKCIDGFGVRLRTNLIPSFLIAQILFHLSKLIQKRLVTF